MVGGYQTKTTKSKKDTSNNKYLGHNCVFAPLPRLIDIKKELLKSNGKSYWNRSRNN